jgi:hypothetical protein
MIQTTETSRCNGGQLLDTPTFSSWNHLGIINWLYLHLAPPRFLITTLPEPQEEFPNSKAMVGPGTQESWFQWQSEVMVLGKTLYAVHISVQDELKLDHEID